MDEASDLLMQMNLMRDERLNFAMACSTHEVCMRGIRVTYLIGQLFRGRDIDFIQLIQFRFGEIFLKIGWLPIMTVKEPIYPKLIQTFYSNVIVHVGGSITISCSLREVNIMLNEEKICEILGVQSDGDKVYESKSLSNIDGFVVGDAI